MKNKYRGWDTNRKKMYSPETMGADELTLAVDGRGFVNVNGQSQKLSQYYPHILPLQFTGLKDKNGVEIYEGDVVVYRDISGSGRPRDFGPRKVRWYRDSCNFNVMRPANGSELEVIGNIHENPELLEP